METIIEKLPQPERLSLTVQACQKNRKGEFRLCLFSIETREQFNLCSQGIF